MTACQNYKFTFQNILAMHVWTEFVIHNCFGFSSSSQEVIVCLISSLSTTILVVGWLACLNQNNSFEFKWALLNNLRTRRQEMFKIIYIVTFHNENICL